MTNNWMATISLNRFPIETLLIQVGPTHGIGGHLQSLKERKNKKRSLYTLYMLSYLILLHIYGDINAESFLPSKISLNLFNILVRLDGHKTKN